MLRKVNRMVASFWFVAAFAALLAQSAAAAISGAIYTSKGDGTNVNANLYLNKADVYLNGGPQNQNAAGLPLGTYYFQVTNPNGDVLLSTDNAVCRQVVVANNIGGNGVIFGVPGVTPAGCTTGLHAVGGVPPGTPNPANGSVPVQLIPFNDTPNNGGEYKVWLIATCATPNALDPTKLDIPSGCGSKTDNFKVKTDCLIGIGPFPFPPPNGPPTCFAVMPVRKTIAGRTPSCDSPVVQTSSNTVNTITTDTTIETATCTDSVVGSTDRVCTIITTTDTSTNPATVNTTRTCVAANVNYLNVFEVDLFANVDTDPTQPDGFPSAVAGRLWIPPTEDPLAPQGALFSICEVNIPLGWHLPDNGVTTVATFLGTPNVVTNGSPAVYTPTASTNGDRSRCWNVTIPVADTFEIFVNNVPTGKIVVSKLSLGGTGVFDFLASGGGDCNVTVGGLPVCVPPGGFGGTFQLNTGITTNPALTNPYTVAARVNTTPPLAVQNPALPPPYRIEETGVPVPPSDWATTFSCVGNIATQGTNSGLASSFGLIPGETVTCAYINKKKPRLILKKDLVPDSDTGSFKLQINGTANELTVTGPESAPFPPLGPIVVNFGDNTVGEVGGVNTLLSNYNTSISCVDNNNVSVPTTGGALNTTSNSRTWTVTLGDSSAGKTVTCLITNSLPVPRFTGGGSFYPNTSDTNPQHSTFSSVRITHGFTLHCNKDLLPNRLEVNWAGPGPGNPRGKQAENNFHLTELKSAHCFDDDQIDEQSPETNVDTYEGWGVGRFNNADGFRAHWVFTDAGEPGKDDEVWMVIENIATGVDVLRVGGAWDIAPSSTPFNLLTEAQLEALVPGNGLRTGTDGANINSGNQQAHLDE